MNLLTPQGWQCPVCKHVYSPNVSVCLYCPGELVFTITTNDEEPIEEQSNEKMLDDLEQFDKYLEEQPE